MARSNRSTKNLVGPYFGEFAITSPIEKVSLALDSLPRNDIDYSPWSDSTDKPDVSFAFAHGRKCVLIKYFVREPVIRATYFRAQDPVYEDSCVEFFVRFNDEPEYYNFEFNILGACLLYFGPDRHDRVPAPTEEISTMRFFANLQNVSIEGRNEMDWQLTVMIPLTVFFKHKFETMTGVATRANFQKCGDSLPSPHYLVWNYIESENPDFHRPEFFGEVEFE
jgi:hypothetical protein